MRRLLSALTAVLIILWPACSLAAHGLISYSGTVDADRDIAVEASITASVDEVNIKVGDYVTAGDTVAVLRSTKVYAPVSGTVAAIFAPESYDATVSTNRYGAVLFIEPINKYTIYVDDKYAYESVEAMYPHLGDTVYLKCVTDGSHVGIGRLTAIDDEGVYTVETTAGEFYPGEAVRVFNKQRKYDADRIGRGTIIPTADEKVTGVGYVAKMHVSLGDTVEKGQLLFETVEGLYEPGNYTGLEVVAPATGIVTEVSVSAGDVVSAHNVIARMCPIENMQVKMSLTEEDLAEVKVGDGMEVVFEQIPGELHVNGTVSDIMYIPESVLESAEKDSNSTGQTNAALSSQTETENETDDTIYYSAYIDLGVVPQLRLGMTATVYSLD